MVTTLLIGAVIFLGSVLCFDALLKYKEWEKEMEERDRKADRNWQTVFERTDLRKTEA